MSTTPIKTWYNDGTFPEIEDLEFLDEDYPTLDHAAFEVTSLVMVHLQNPGHLFGVVVPYLASSINTETGLHRLVLREVQAAIKKMGYLGFVVYYSHNKQAELYTTG